MTRPIHFAPVALALLVGAGCQVEEPDLKEDLRELEPELEAREGWTPIARADLVAFYDRQRAIEAGPRRRAVDLLQDAVDELSRRAVDADRLSDPDDPMRRRFDEALVRLDAVRSAEEWRPVADVLNLELLDMANDLAGTTR